MKLSLGYSPCPNDCFIFYALAHGKVAPEITWEIVLDDVESLNRMAREVVLDVSKVSYHAAGHLLDDYVMLRSGGALGKRVGPLVVAREPLATLKGRRVAIPGGLTTANLLLALAEPHAETVAMRYETIMPAVVKGEVDAGLIIHESRFVYPDYGLKKLLDLGEWWEEETTLPLPLGGIVARRSLGTEALRWIDRSIRASLGYAYAHRAEAQPYIAAHAQEMSEEVMQKHIDLYVNAYSFDVGEEGERAVRELFSRAQARGLLPEVPEDIFVPEPFGR
jgi:1,4-dihydroxy-6-naphthoate synthase